MDGVHCHLRTLQDQFQVEVVPGPRCQLEAEKPALSYNTTGSLRLSVITCSQAAGEYQWQCSNSDARRVVQTSLPFTNSTTTNIVLMTL